MFVFKNGSWQDKWPHHRSPYWRIALIVFLVHLLVFVFAPPFHFKPYRLEAQEIMVVQDVPDIVIPPPVGAEPRMPAVIEPWEGDLEKEPVVPPNVGDIFKNWVPPRSPAQGEPDFVPFDKPPVPIHLVMPAYPDLAREAGIEGIVLVKVRIDENGKVTGASVLRSTVTESMNRAALEAARRCTFEPARQGTKAVPVVVAIPFEFRLEKR